MYRRVLFSTIVTALCLTLPATAQSDLDLESSGATAGTSLGAGATPGVANEILWKQKVSAGLSLGSSGRHAEALRTLESALQDAKAFGENDRRVATTLHNLSEEYRLLGRLKEAETSCRRASAIFESTEGPDSAAVGDTLNSLGNVLSEECEHKEACETLKRAVAVRTKGYGADSVRVGTSLGNLGAACIQAGDYDEGEKALKQAIAIKTKALGENHEEIAYLLNSLATLYERTGKAAPAEETYKRSLAIREAAFGKSDPRVATGLNNLAEFYSQSGRDADAEPLYKRCLTILDAYPGSQDVNIAGTLNNLGRVYVAQKKYADAESALKRSLSMREKIFGPDHPLCAVVISNMGVLSAARGNVKESLPYIDRAIAISEKRQGPDNPETVEYRKMRQMFSAQLATGGTPSGLKGIGGTPPSGSLPGPKSTGGTTIDSPYGKITVKSDAEKQWVTNFSAGQSAFKAGQFVQAVEHLQKALSVAGKLPETNTVIFVTCLQLGDACQKAGRQLEAEDAYKKALQAADKVVPPDTKAVHSALSRLSGNYLAQRKFKEAQPVLERCVALGGKVKDVPPETEALMMAGLATVYASTGRLTDGKALMHRAVDVATKGLGAAHMTTLRLRLAEQKLQKL